MSRTLLLGALGLVLAVALGFGVHVLTRDTVANPVVRLDRDPGLAPVVTTTVVTTTATSSSGSTEETETDDGDSGRGRGRGRGRSGGDD